MQCNRCGELLEERYLKLHRDRFCLGYELGFRRLLRTNRFYRIAFFGYITTVVIVGIWLLSFIL